MCPAMISTEKGVWNLHSPVSTELTSQFQNYCTAPLEDATPATVRIKLEYQSCTKDKNSFMNWVSEMPPSLFSFID